MTAAWPVWADLDRGWERQLTVDLLAVPLQGVRSVADARSTREEMERRNWHVMAVIAGAAGADGYSGYVRRVDLDQRTVGEVLRPFTVDTLVAGSAPIRDVLSRVAEREHLFVLGPTGVRSIVTTADLGKPPVRLVIFATVSLLEMVMGDVIRREFSEADWIEHLPPKRLEKARSLQMERVKQDQELDLVACLQICDKATIIGSSSALQELLEFGSKRRLQRFFVEFERLRNNVAHAHELGVKPDWRVIAELLGQSERLLRLLSGRLEHGEMRDTADGNN